MLVKPFFFLSQMRIFMYFFRFELNMLIVENTSAINQLVQTLREMAELTDEALTMVTFNIARLDGMRHPSETGAMASLFSPFSLSVCVQTELPYMAFLGDTTGKVLVDHGALLR